MGKLVRAMSENGSAVCWALDSTDMVATLERYHQPSAVVTAAAGRLLTAASIMGSMLKTDRGSVTLRITADGPAGTVIAVAGADGHARAYAANPVVELPLNPQGKLDVSGAVGRNGSLFVVKDLGMGEPYVGVLPLVSGEIAEDLTRYFHDSEQVPAACALGVLVNPDLTVQAAGGWILQLLPGAGEEEARLAEENVLSLPSMTQMLVSGLGPEEIARRVLAGMGPHILDSRVAEYRCGCSRERMAAALRSLDAGELRAMAEEDGQAELCCHFCPNRYTFTKEELLAIIGEKTLDTGTDL